MTAGIQIRNPTTGVLMVDITTRLKKILGSVTIQAGVSGSLNDARLASGQAVIAFQPAKIWGWLVGNVARPNFYVSGTTISWSYSAMSGDNGEFVGGTMFYGVY
ncbi:hypothetical protein [Paraburkholderia tropica]|uniref:hypothetical protein n=1 Tax=Paraburkholderia tropica TaxID=92647 RepID=UPI002AB010D4|nr:hypothetical protein [Paraburkholderia tropica]